MSSEKVSIFALREAAWLIDRMLDGREDLRRAIIGNRVRVVVQGVSEMTTAVPEYAELKPAKYWDRRARGLGATKSIPVQSAGEENLLNYPGDPYSTESIFVHEFAHVIHQMGMNSLDATFNDRLEKTWKAAVNAGLWKGKYAGSNASEYWAEGVQSWFDTNRENDHDHNHVNTRAELKEYDPGLAALIAEVLGDRPWRYRKVMERPVEERAHVVGYDPSAAPRFEWPRELAEVPLVPAH